MIENSNFVVTLECVITDPYKLECFGIYNLQKKNPRFSMPVRTTMIDYREGMVEYEFYSFNAKRVETGTMKIDHFMERATFSGIVGEPLDKFLD